MNFIQSDNITNNSINIMGMIKDMEVEVMPIPAVEEPVDMPMTTEDYEPGYVYKEETGSEDEEVSNNEGENYEGEVVDGEFMGDADYAGEDYGDEGIYSEPDGGFDMGEMPGEEYEGMYGEVGMEGMDGTESGSSFKPMSSWLFIIGISIVAIAAGVTLGLLLAKRKIKKGLDLYED